MIKYGQLERNDEDKVEEIYNLLNSNVKDYPNIFHWYYTKVVPNLNKTREIIVAIDESNQIVGFTIVKNEEEKKICSLYVIPQYRNKGIGTLLLNKAMVVLKMRKPLITVNNKVLDYYLPLFTKLGYNLRHTYRDYYVKDVVEYCFNGKLPDKKFVKVDI